MTARDDYPNLALEATWHVGVKRAGREAGEALDEIDRLRRWQAEAKIVQGLWDGAFERCQPLGRIGDFKASAMADEIIRLRRELGLT